MRATDRPSRQDPKLQSSVPKADALSITLRGRNTLNDCSMAVVDGKLANALLISISAVTNVLRLAINSVGKLIVVDNYSFGVIDLLQWSQLLEILIKNLYVISFEL
uniref:Uncharacterized protein n=1 Tax=Syphacia muris TaxID=451379 RepID=A0A158R653_9BILA